MFPLVDISAESLYISSEFATQVTNILICKLEDSEDCSLRLCEVMKLTLATLLALAVLVVLTEATNYKRAYCGGETYVGNPGSKAPHLHCDKSYMALKAKDGQHTNFLDKKGARCSVIRNLDSSKWSTASNPGAITTAVSNFLGGECRKVDLMRLFRFLQLLQN